MAKRKFGTCKLTGAEGRFVRSHLIPNAFHKRAGRSPFLEHAGGGRFKRRYTGPYDPELVTRPGEDLLEELDQYAAALLVGSGLLYRDRRDENLRLQRSASDEALLLKIPLPDPFKFHRFSVSLLWRCAVTRMRFGSLASVEEETLCELRDAIVCKRELDAFEYPCIVSCFDSAVELSKIDPYPVDIEGISFFRFFLDGVIVYQSPERDNTDVARFGKLLVGSDEYINMLCVPSLSSDIAAFEDQQIREWNARYGDIFRGFR